MFHQVLLYPVQVLKKRRGDGPCTALEKAWVNDLHKQLDEKIARAFYSRGKQQMYSQVFCFCASIILEVVDYISVHLAD